MSLSVIHWLSHFPKNVLIPFQYIQTKGYAVKAPVKAPSSKKLKKFGIKTVEKKVLPIETDAHKLVNYVCGSNFYKEGEDVKIKPDSEYPSWLWTIRIGPPATLEELDPNTKQYWRKLRLLGLRRNNKQKQTRKF